MTGTPPIDADRTFWKWQGQVTQALEHLKESVEKIETDRTTSRDYKSLCDKVTRLQKTVDDIPGAVQKAVTDAYQKAETSFNQRIEDIGLLDLRIKTDTAVTDIATLKEATGTLKKTAMRYGLIGGGGTAVLTILAALIYFLLTGETPPGK